MNKGMAGFFNELSVWLARDFGLEAHSFGEGALTDALRLRQQSVGLIDIDTYTELWRSRGDERQRLLDCLLVGETWFFREWPAFLRLQQWLETDVSRISRNGPLRILTLPCATGEEAWSIAAILWKAGFRENEAIIDAMDISEPSLLVAREGVYPARRMRGQTGQRWSHLLEMTDTSTVRVASCLKGLAKFRRGNAMDRDFLTGQLPYHIVFCRNMLIYMSPSARLQICQTLGEILLPGGLLFLGHAETAPAESGFRRSEGAGAFAWQKNECAGTGTVASPKTSAAVRPTSAPSAPRIGRQSFEQPMVSRISPPVRPGILPPSLAIGQGQTDSISRSASPISLSSVRELADQGHYSDALEWLESDAGLASLDPDVHCLAGILLSASGNAGDAITRFRRSIYLQPDHEESLTHLLLILEREGDIAGASRLKSRLEVRQKVTS